MLKRLLIVDDEIDHRLILRTRFEKHGFVCEEAEDGTVAMEKLTIQTMDVVLTDQHMPRMNGLQLIEQMGRLQLLKNTPVILLTSQLIDKMFSQASQAGARAVISKPYDFPKLLEEVRRAIGQSETVCNSSKS
jgi:two-component system chemotaxis response regulator CheY